jgi:23S rRNA (adenine2503-C2)-methyltransferase
MDRKRNLDAAEIYDQVVRIREQCEAQYGTPLTNIVYMGMGEPLLNYANVVESVRRITAPDGLNMAPRRITISTAGIAKMIKKLADDDVKANLALSLHAPNDVKRNEIMPINEANSLAALKEALQYYHQKTGRKVTYEYIVFENFNDSLEDAAELLAISKWLPCKINLIEYNPIENADYRNAESDKITAFHKFLADRGVQTNIRRSRGKDIDAACGQLANKEKAEAA